MKIIMQKNKLIVWLLLLWLTIPLCGYAQSIIVKGNVVDENGEAVIGATILEKGNKKNGTISDFDGNFSLTVSSLRSKLIASYVGMETVEVSLKGRSDVKITLKDDSKLLDEVVVIGYAEVKRKDLTGAVSSVGAKTLKDIPVTSAASAITGRMAGVAVTTTEGSPDADIQIRVRGGGSITQDNSPLFIVDGFEVDNINNIPPTDIETIDVLKDASSTAIYGAKGANGVILVTTKSGEAGKAKIEFNASVGASRVYNMNDMMSPYEYVYIQRELDPSPSAGWFGRYGKWEDIGIYKGKEGTDWQDKMFGNTGVKQNYSLTLSGGTKDFKYSVTYTHDNETYIMETSELKRDYLNAKLSKDINKKLKVDLSMRMTKTVIDGPKVSTGNRLRNIVKYAPIGTLEALQEGDRGEDIYDEEDISNLNDPWYNIVNNYKKQNQFLNVYNLGLTWEMLKGLSLRTQGSYTFQYDDTDDIYTNNTGEASYNGGMPVANRSYVKGHRYSWQNTLQYKLKKKDHRFDALLGFEINEKATDEMKIQSKFFPIDFTAADILAMWNNGTSQPVYTTIKEPSRTSSFFGRANYTFKDRYYLTITAREDGTNVFAPGNKWGFFPGVALAWRISEEKFMQVTNSWLSNTKLRLSYGLVGNARVGSYWRQNYSFDSKSSNLYYPGESSIGAMKPDKTLRNEKLTWETKYSFNTGLDFSLFNDRLNVILDYYNDKTKDLILAVQIPQTSGYEQQYQNLGQTTNKGVELTLNANVINTKDFSLGVNFNIAFNKNKVDMLDGNDEMIVSSNTTDVGKDDYRVIVGQELGLMYGYVVDGMYGFNDFDFDQKTKTWKIKEGVVDCYSIMSRSGNYYGPGHIKLKDLDGDGVITADGDRQVIGHALPKHTGGFSVNAGWKGIDLSAMFNWSYGNDVLNAGKIDYTTYAGSKKYENFSTIMNLEHRFTTIDPETGQNIYYGDYANPVRLQAINQNATIWHPLTNNTIFTDWAVEDGSFLRFSNLTIGYTLSQHLTRRFGVSNLRVYVTANNLHIWTRYSGQDPEVSTSGNNLAPGKDTSAYPKCHSYILGLNITF